MSPANSNNGSIDGSYGRQPADGYAGDVPPLGAWQMLQDQPGNTLLIDVRTQMEWTRIGTPDLPAANLPLMCCEWQTAPDMAINSDFIEQVEANIQALSLPKETNLLLLCRTGVRSRAAAQALTSAGYSSAYNVSEGFEGAPDETGMRGKIDGWQAAGLSWSLTQSNT